MDRTKAQQQARWTYADWLVVAPLFYPCAGPTGPASPAWESADARRGSVPPFLFVKNFLESVLHAELQDARVAGLRLNPAEVPRAEVRDRVAPVEVVQQVERLEADLDVLRRREREHPRQREVDLPEARTADAVQLVVAEHTERRLLERGPVQVAGQALVIGVDIVRDLIDAQAGRAAESVERVLTGRHRQPAARPRRHDARQPPVRRQRAHHRVANLGRLVADRRVDDVGAILRAVA